MKIAVTAVSGQLGGAIVKALTAVRGPESVVGLARTPERAQGLGIEVRPGDYDQPEQLASSLVGVDAVLLVSGMAPPEERVQQHRNVIDAARAGGARRIVYTSIQGLEDQTGFSPVVKSNRQTEDDVRTSGMEWSIGRNGVYIEPEVAYIETYRAMGEIVNCAGDGLCGFTTRDELANAYARMLIGAEHAGNTYNLHGERLTQTELAGYLNRTFGTQLTYRRMSDEAFRQDRIHEHGPFLGTIIAGIYEGIRQGAWDNDSDYEAAAGRPHQSWEDYFGALRQAQGSD